LKKDNGKYYFPLYLINKGTVPATEWYSYYATPVFAKELSNAQLDTEFDKLVGNPLDAQILGVKSAGAIANRHSEIASDIEIDVQNEVVNPGAGFTEEQMHNINQGNGVAYVFFTIRFSDKISASDGIYYLSSLCEIYNAQIHSMLRCTRHNFLKRIAE
jgi:hypothetical protein